MKIPTSQPSTPSDNVRPHAAGAAKDLEAYFLRHVFREAGVGQSTVGEKNFTTETFAELLQGALADQIAEEGGLGLARALKRQLAETLDAFSSAIEETFDGPSLPVVPVDGALTSSFGRRHDPLTSGTRRHHGVDIAAPSGTPVRSAGAGVVTFVGRRGGYGKLVVVQHGHGVETRYAHLEDTLVRLDERVPAGGLVGRVGMTGRATGPHLHFEVRHYDAPVDPTEAVIGLNESEPRSKQ